MDSLMSQPTLGHIRQALKNLPQGIKGLDETYEQAMRRIECQDEGYRELAKQVLSWVTHAKRALSIAEVQHAVAVSAGMAEMDKDFLPEVEILDSVCAGLVTVNENSGIIQLVHYTTREYFERKSSFSNAETDITVTCVTYLSFDTFATGFCVTDEEFEERLQLNPLYDYAARNWGHHARAATTEVVQLILGLLESEAKVAGSSQAMMASGRYPGYSQTVPRQMIGVHVAAYFGLREAMIALFGNGYDPNIKDTYGRTPLWWAAKNGHEAVVKLLLDKEGIDPDSKDSYNGRTPLWWAATNGYEAVVELLLDKGGVDPDSEENYNGRTPLWWAAANGHEAVVKLLLDKEGVDPDSKDNYNGRTPLSWAAANGHEAVVKLLLDKEGVDLDSKDSYNGRTPLSWVAANGHEAVVKLLLDKEGVDLDSKDSYNGQTPLSWAATNGHEAVVKLLLDKEDVNPDSKDHSYGRTPLSWAAANGHEAVVKLFQSRGALSL
jgi:ankyrin repeat protein